VREKGLRGKCRHVHRGTEPSVLSLPGLRAGRRSPAEGECPPFRHRTDRSQADAPRVGRPPRGVSPLWGGTLGSPIRGSATRGATVYGATLGFDRFHVIRLYNEKLSALRRDLHRALTDTMRAKALQGVRWLLLKRPENLDRSRREPQQLREALRLNEPPATACYLKGEFNEIWEQDEPVVAEASLRDWIASAEASGIRMFHDFAKPLRLHAPGILAQYDFPISTALTLSIRSEKRQPARWTREARSETCAEPARWPMLTFHARPRILGSLNV
jgi:hypothetical protein